MSFSLIKKLNVVLDKKQKNRIKILLVLILIGGLLETVGLSLVLPLVSAILDQETFAKNEYVVLAMNVLKLKDMEALIYILLFSLMGMFIIKNAYLIGLTYIQAKFVNNNRCRCTTNLLSQYLNRPYEYYLYAETSDIIRTIYGDMDNVFNLLLQCMNLVAELVVSVCLGIFLLIIDWKMMFVVVGLLLAVTIFVTKVIKPQLNTVGEKARVSLSSVYKWILQSVSGIKEVKVANREQHFVRNYYYSSRAYADSQVGNNVLTNLPRLLIETITIVGILGYVAVSLAMGVELSSLIPLISAFALAAMRLLPSVNRVNTYIANIAYYEPALNFIYDTVDTSGLNNNELIKNIEKSEVHNSAITMKDSIEIENLTYAYPNTDKYIFSDANMSIPVGKSIGIIGPSGAGKTTIVDILLGLLKIQNGTIKSDGMSILDDYKGWLSHIGYIPQTIYMLDDSIRANIAFGVRDEDIDDKRIWEVLDEAQMGDFVRQLPEGLDSQIGERGVRISGGQRQRLGIARALYNNPELLVFDEATSALDNDTETAIMEAIEMLHGQKTMVIIAHRLRTIENCDIIYEVSNQKINVKKN